jgi:hypothetical protein
VEEASPPEKIFSAGYIARASVYCQSGTAYKRL